MYDSAKPLSLKERGFQIPEEFESDRSGTRTVSLSLVGRLGKMQESYLFFEVKMTLGIDSSLIIRDCQNDIKPEKIFSLEETMRNLVCKGFVDMCRASCC